MEDAAVHFLLKFKENVRRPQDLSLKQGDLQRSGKFIHRSKNSCYYNYQQV